VLPSTLKGKVDLDRPDFSLGDLVAEVEALMVKEAENAFTLRDICEFMGLNHLRSRDFQVVQRAIRALRAEGKLVYAGKKRQPRVDGSLYPFIAYRWIDQKEAIE